MFSLDRPPDSSRLLVSAVLPLIDKKVHAPDRLMHIIAPRYGVRKFAQPNLSLQQENGQTKLHTLGTSGSNASIEGARQIWFAGKIIF